ncbi:hypothetical protein DIPPA_18615 [Diplonema papillatum]|nr:hypothetical protein DIPPA_18615 [Diplonema papillatum]
MQCVEHIFHTSKQQELERVSALLRGNEPVRVPALLFLKRIYKRCHKPAAAAQRQRKHTKRAQNETTRGEENQTERKHVRKPGPTAMEEIQQYLAKAQLLAETAEDEAHYCTVFGIVKILLILSERMGRKHPTVGAEKAPKKEAKAEAKAEPRKTQANWKADAPAVRREGAWTTVPPKGGPKSAEAKPKQEMKSGWLKVACHPLDCKIRRGGDNFKRRDDNCSRHHVSTR